MDLNTLVGTDLDALVKILRQQASQNQTVVFNSDFLSDSQIIALREGFALGAGTFLTINGITPADIPDPSNQQVVLTAGTVDVLSQSHCSLRVIFTVDSAQTLQFIVSVALPVDWQFKDSFPSLTPFPFDQVTANASYAIYDTEATRVFTPWPDQPAESVALLPGLNLATWLKLDIFSGALMLLEQVLNATDRYKFFGPINAGGSAPYPAMDVASLLADKTFTITSGLVVGNLALAIDVSAPRSGLQDLGMRFQAGTQDLNFGVEILSNNLQLSFFAEPIPGHTFGVNQILSLPGGSGFQQYIPPELSHAFDAATLQSFVITEGAGGNIGMTGFVIGSNAGYQLVLIKDVLVLTNLCLDMNSYLPGAAGSFTVASLSASAQIFPDIFTGQFNFYLELTQTPSAGWQIDRVTGAYLGEVRLSDLVRGIVGNTALLPDVLSDIRFANFGVIVSKEGGGYSYTLYGQVNIGLPIMDTTLVSSLSVVATYSPDGYSVVLRGSFLVGAQNFQLELDLGKSGTKAPDNPTIIMSASWQAADPANYLEFEDIAEAFGFSGDEIPAIPDDLDLALKQANFYYDYTNGKLLLGCESDTYGSADFAAVRNPASKQWQYFFGLNIDKPIPISNLPLIGNLLPKEDTVQITQIQVVIASAAFSDALATEVNAIISKLGGNYPQIPDNNQQGMPAGLGFSMVVAVGTYQIPIMFGAGQSTKSQALIGAPAFAGERRALTLASGPQNAPVSSAASSDGVIWFNVQKTFGPVSIQKIGVQYKNEKIYVLVNMTLTGAGLSIGLLGFGIGSPISSFTPSFAIQGIDVTYSGGGVEVSGGLRGSIDPVNFVGELLVNAEGFGIAGLAGYTSFEGSPSMFLYAVLNAPLGGPPCFFVTGVAGGFGFNRDLQVPDVSGVATFPLVEWAQGQNNPPGMDMTGDIGAQVNAVLERLSNGGVVAPQVGEYWLSAGVKFTSFELANSFALAVVKFGADFEVDLLGTTIIAIPPAAPVIFAEMQLLASFKPADGFVGIAGQLTSRSYVLSPDCHLTGGFAYYFWFDGPLAGNFVITMGGYNPNFQVPDFYPNVPRLGINWNVSDNLVVKGDEYFAVTSAAVMAGGGLSATWSSGGIKAWFNVQADFLMVYKPFHYYIDASVDIGASFRISLIFTHITITIHVGASLEIWGPDFTGKATIDLDIISFTISFGASGKDTQTTIPWSRFVTEMLPGLTPASFGAPDASRRTLAASAAQKDVSGIHVNVTSGLVKSLGDDPSALDFVVNPEAVEITINTTIPVKEKYARFDGLVELAPEQYQPKAPDGQPIKPNDAFGVAPVGVANDDFIPTLTVSIALTNNPDTLAEVGAQITLQCVRILSNAPSALWQKIAFDSHGNPVLTDPLTDTAVPDVIVGYRIVPVPLVPDHTLPINLEYLKYTIAPRIQHFAWSTAYVPTSDDFTDQTVEDTIMSPTAQANRAALLPVLHQYLPDIATTVDLDNMVDGTHAGLLAQPVLRLLGEEKTAA
ncbi:hypothetical protein WI72_10490 [Burkholderia ubonensis]|uniref:DUF6603 domain-containing protein n=1 Tax=Burkholderia ubonensis TaxID=101571 RepID=UPI0007588AA0|nr:DUF6603 domain-containing protein [Burkholderia ubonensis]KVC62208.1 hypothetical protein WI72_10490 [Burkholderia ubonensis]KVD93425.1 hypothetical protein WI90_00270 [Burkholderia ubonensis]